MKISLYSRHDLHEKQEPTVPGKPSKNNRAYLGVVLYFLDPYSINSNNILKLIASSVFREEVVDLQLPEKKEKVIASVIPISEPKIKFRQKKVDTLGAELVAFKKRKLTSAAQNLRKRDDDS